jgi:hypothetical protein
MADIPWNHPPMFGLYNKRYELYPEYYLKVNGSKIVWMKKVHNHVPDSFRV